MTVVFGCKRAGGIALPALCFPNKANKKEQIQNTYMKRTIWIIKLAGLLLTSMSALFLMGCSEDNEDESTLSNDIQGLEIVEHKQTLLLGESVQFGITILPETAKDQNVFWGSTDEDVAIVDQSGLVTGIAPGTATITVVSKSNLRISDVVPIQVENINFNK
ncbi:Ig-like domain-containing protein [Flagellimonas pelagia]|uniref:Ig-like domain-containing protein n=1 Tax=Flagellimonas pelagia TaxID=2306998 RepID=A0A3A1NJ61_9FLAO|nr:Ig-like domain-containing protein [Allomuricauda maritima]RIV44935.1 Ig-like domain-containing protein [Allomuricauda maritima]TXJ95847.1 Ig-like domain-containing protein [Allomuricauda maritima]